MTLSEIRDWLRSFGVAENYYIGRLENKKERSLGVYSRAGTGPPVMAIGGLDCGSYDIRSVTLLLHWNRNARETDAAARALWDCLIQAGGFVGPEGTYVQFVRPTVPEPVEVGTDSGGVYEYSIPCEFVWRRHGVPSVDVEDETICLRSGAWIGQDESGENVLHT